MHKASSPTLPSSVQHRSLHRGSGTLLTRHDQGERSPQPWPTNSTSRTMLDTHHRQTKVRLSIPQPPPWPQPQLHLQRRQLRRCHPMNRVSDLPHDLHEVQVTNRHLQHARPRIRQTERKRSRRAHHGHAINDDLDNPTPEPGNVQVRERASELFHAAVIQRRTSPGGSVDAGRGGGILLGSRHARPGLLR
ncbi:hypothetical protein BD310DRAFT_938133 [Dichomitus squalens]|uniref:Uncharacterized protein n=1 Tax=Dichomitus squalens TaxID=114155 RepID=A0A4Q9PHP5_9APHY|nr:hypothetical protein BD310DRAFT_938133 [Dichomitus squalens]